MKVLSIALKTLCLPVLVVLAIGHALVDHRESFRRILEGK